MYKNEQILNNEVVFDFDEILSVSDISNILGKNVKLETNKNPFLCSVKGKEIRLFVKQVTYLGKPHKLFKKRIQISSGWQEELKNENALLLGLYKYKDAIIYVLFNKTNYVKRVVNNSSAHVYTFDLLKASEDGIFTKTDMRGNIITCIRSDKLQDFLEKYIDTGDYHQEEITLFEDFKGTLKKIYKGDECYAEMMDNAYNNARQPEWAGFFIEYKFGKFLQNFPEKTKICTYESRKKSGDIDLDINFHDEFLGDLKTHSNDSNAILGNDKGNIELALGKYSKIWYIVFSHDTKKDKDYDYEITKYWNRLLKKGNLLSYGNRMKYEIKFTDMKILEINAYNSQYLTIFKQGRNSNGNVRESKISIKNKDINNFLIHYSKI